MSDESKIWHAAHEPDATEADLAALVRLIDDGHPPHCGCEECEPMSSQAILDTCPFCGARQTSPGYYNCGSVEKAGWYRHEICLGRQIANLTATIAEQAELLNGFWTLRKAIGEYTSRRGNHQRDDHSQCVLCDAMTATRNLADSLRREELAFADLTLDDE